MLAPSFCRFLYRYRVSVVVLSFCLLLETLIHNYSYYVARPSTPLDPPFRSGCQEPPSQVRSEDRENAAIVMLARNSELSAAVASIISLEQQFNRWWHYPIVFITGEAQGFNKEFVDALTAVTSGETRFEEVKQDVWGYPQWIDVQQARQSAKQQEALGVKYGGMDNYHHMCRFYSGNFYDHEALQRYKWYWRVEPGVEFTCAITYDPFAAMVQHNKTYGYTIALWEVPNTAPSLFRQISAYKDAQKIPTTDMWRNMVDPSWAPFFLRQLMPSKVLRDRHGDVWNLCHYWGNFEIADMDFFRSDAYRSYFEALDTAGGFYYERWGDAPVRSLGAALFLEPHQLHYFADFGYRHAPFQLCPKNAAGQQSPGSSALGPKSGDWSEEYENGVGCRCTCDPFGFTNRPICRNKLRKGVD